MAKKAKRKVPSFEQVMDDFVIKRELMDLYAVLCDKITKNIDDWECIVADRMHSLITGEKFDGRSVKDGGKYAHTAHSFQYRGKEWPSKFIE